MKMKALIISLGLLLAACGGASEGQFTELPQYYEQQVEWKACDDFFRCADIKVPLDYNNLEAGSIKLALAMHSADKPDQRAGYLVLNPGGPGGSGIDYVESYESQLSETLSNSFDLVSWDPRGVGRSERIKCEDPAELDAFLAIDPTPDDTSEQKALAASYKKFGEACAANSGELLQHVSTTETVKDLDIIRAVLGEDKLNFLGKSGGTQIGALYAHLWPEHVGNFVLDGAVDMAISGPELALGQAIGFDTALRRFTMFCADAANECGIGVDTDAVLTFIRDLLAGLDQKPLPTSDKARPLTEGLAWSAVLGALYSPIDGWPWLGDALAQAKSGNGNGLLSIADWFNGRNQDGTFIDNATEVFFATTCLDYPDDQLTPALMESQFVAMAPIVGKLMAWGEAACESWPAKGQSLSGAVGASGSNPILVIGTSYDPATPNGWARKLAVELGTGVYINFDGDGHTGYYCGSTKLDKAVDDFLIAGVVPAANSSYLPDQPLL